MIEAVLCVVVGYAIGSVPVGWLVGRAAGVDLRRAGSGNPGAANLIESVSPAVGVAVGLLQITQGVLPVALAALLDTTEATQVTAGIAAVVANNWNPWLDFSGGRGIGTTIGVLLGTTWVALAAFVVVALAGRLMRRAPEGVALGLLAAPLVAWITGVDGAFVAGAAVLAAIALLKRLTANERPPIDAPRPAVWWYRLAYDRDMRDREEWLRRFDGRGEHAGIERS